MALLNVKPFRVDEIIADQVVKHTGPVQEKVAKFVTWGGDEHILLAFSAAWWVYTRGQPSAPRRAGNHVLLCTLASAAVPHVLKLVFDQMRPDRLTLVGHLRGAPLSGKRKDAFPSGHAVHLGALASAATTLPATQRNAVWGLCTTLVVTRVVLLAHWASDVAAGLLVGAAIERLIRPITEFGQVPTSFVKDRQSKNQLSAS